MKASLADTLHLLAADGFRFMTCFEKPTNQSSSHLVLAVPAFLMLSFASLKAFFGWGFERQTRTCFCRLQQLCRVGWFRDEPDFKILSASLFDCVFMGCWCNIFNDSAKPAALAHSIAHFDFFLSLSRFVFVSPPHCWIWLPLLS